MLPEIGATELLVIAAVALIVVGPKDLPLLLRKLGQFMGKLRSMAADFRASFDEMARQSELDELRAEVEAMRKGQIAEMAALQAGDAQVSKVFQEIDQGLSSSVTFPPSAISPSDAMAPLEEPAARPGLEPVAKPKTPRKAPAKKTAAPKAAPEAAPKAAPKAAKPPAKATTMAPPIPGKPRGRKTGSVT